MTGRVIHRKAGRGLSYPQVLGDGSLGRARPAPSAHVSRIVLAAPGAQAAAVACRPGTEIGIDPDTMRGRMRSGRWQRLQRGVYATFSGEPGRETVLWAALLRAGPDAVLSHKTAAERHGLIDEPASIITITVPASKRPARVKIPGVVIHRSDAILRTRHPAMLPPCTRVEDTVLDLIQAAASLDDGYAWICRAIGRRRTTADRIRQAMDARGKMSWRDKRRDRANAVQGIITLRFGVLDLGDHRCETAAQVAAVLRGRGWPGAPCPCSRPDCCAGVTRAWGAGGVRGLGLRLCRLRGAGRG
jgi:hypothetical protein